MKPNRIESLLSVALIIFLATSSLAAEPKHGGTLRFGVQKSLTTLNPFVQTQSLNHRVRSLMYESLLSFDRNFEPLPSLAASWTVSPDATVYTFTMRPGVKFHNGKPVTLADVKWAIDYVQDPKNGAFGHADSTVIKQVELEEPDHIRIRLKFPFSPFLSTLAGIHVLPVMPKDSLKTAERPDAFPPGTGPFRFVSWKSGQELRVQRFEGYWQKGLPYLDEVRFIFGLDETTRLNAIRAGDMDISEEMTSDQIIWIRDGKIPGVGYALAAAGNHPRMGINHCRPPFNNLKVRQAFAYALDKQEIINGAYSGLGIPTNQKLFRGTKWFVLEVTDRKYDPQKARALLAEAGYPGGLKITVPGSPGSQKVLQVIQSQVRKAGIEMEILIRDQATHIAALNKAEFEISMSGGATSADPDLTYYGAYHTPPPEQWGKGGRTQPCYSNARVDQLLDEARKVTDFQQRRRMYKEMIEILQEDVADIPIAFVPVGYAFQLQVKGFELSIAEPYSYGNGGVVKTWLDK